MNKLLLVLMACIAAPSAMSQSSKPTKTNYVFERNGRYGYEVPLSDNDLRHGIASKPLIMAVYRGNLDGRETVEIEIPQGIIRLSCERPCAYIDKEEFSASHSHEVIKNDPKIIAGMIMQDALLGRLAVNSN